MYKLLIVEDEALIRKGIKKLVDLESLEISSVYEAENGEEAIKIFYKVQPDIVLLDINIPKINGLTVAEKMKLYFPETKIVILTGYNYFDYAQTAIKIGVDDYILKPISKKDIFEIILKLVHLIKKDMKNKEIKKFLSEVSTIETSESSMNYEKKDYRERIQEIVELFYSDSQFSLSLLAEKLDLSSGYLSYIFKKNFGVSFQDYLLQKRMEMAKLLLLTTELKNYEIAERIGIEDVNYFGLKFKKFYNCSPKQYKEKVLKNENP